MPQPLTPRKGRAPIARPSLLRGPPSSRTRLDYVLGTIPTIVNFGTAAHGVPMSACTGSPRLQRRATSARRARPGTSPARRTVLTHGRRRCDGPHDLEHATPSRSVASVNLRPPLCSSHLPSLAEHGFSARSDCLAMHRLQHCRRHAHTKTLQLTPSNRSCSVV